MSSVRMAMRAKRPKNLTSIAMVTFIVIMVLAILFYVSREMVEKRDSYEKRETYLLEQIEAQNKRSEEIEEYRKYMQTKQYIADMAKAKLGLVYKDEIIFEADN